MIGREEMDIRAAFADVYYCWRRSIKKIDALWRTLLIGSIRHVDEDAG
jgi:hypothetical protein